MVISFAALSLLFLINRLKTAYGWSAVIHPGAWFALVWIFAVACYFTLDIFGGVPVHNPELLDELMTLIISTCGTFILLSYLTALPRSTQKSAMIRKKASTNPSLLKIFGSIGCLGSVINWIGVGAGFGYDDAIRQQWLQEIPRITAITWYLYVLSFPAAISSGLTLASSSLLGRSNPRSTRYFVFLPLLSGALWSLGTGGRQAFGIILLLFIIGVAFGFAIGVREGAPVSSKRLLKMATYSFLAVASLAFFVGLTGLSRAKQHGNEASVFDSIWYLAPVGQFISYNGLAVATHQAYGSPKRRDLSETGPVSLAGLQDFGFRYLTGWRALTVDDTNPERALASSGLELAYGTRNVFYDLQADFGYEMAFVVASVLAATSHFIFLLRISSRQNSNLLPIAPLAMAVMFWGYSHQFSMLMFNTLFWLVLTCFLWDFAYSVLVYAFWGPVQK